MSPTPVSNRNLDYSLALDQPVKPAQKFIQLDKRNLCFRLCQGAMITLSVAYIFSTSHQTVAQDTKHVDHQEKLEMIADPLSSKSGEVVHKTSHKKASSELTTDTVTGADIDRPDQNLTCEDCKDLNTHLDVVVITGSKMREKLSDAVTQVDVITRDHIEATPSENAADLLEEKNGVQVTRSFRGAGVRIQGFDHKHVLVLIDGERQVGRIDGVIDLSRIPVDLIEQVEIVKGPSSSLYGSEAMGGVVNIITRRDAGSDPHLSLRSSYGSRDTIDLNGSAYARLGDWGSRLILNYNHQDAYDWNPSDIATSGSAFSRFTANYKASLRLTANSQIDGRAEYSLIDLQGIDSTSPKLIFDRRNLRETAVFSLKSNIKLDDRAALSGYLSYQIFRDQFVLDQRGSTTRDRDEETQEDLAQTGISYNNTLGQHIVNIGGELFHQKLSADRLLQGQNSRWRGALYAQDEWVFLTDQPLSLVSGLRLDADSQFGYFTSPKLALRFDPHSKVVTRLSYGMGYRAPVFKELYLFFENPSVGYVVEGNPNLTPEKSQSVNLGLEVAPLARLRLTLSGFYHHVDQLIAANLSKSEDVTTSLYQYVNIDEVLHRGLETGASVSISSHLGLNLGYMLTSSYNVKQARQLAGRALHQGTAELKYHHPDQATVASMSVTWSASRPFYTDLDGDMIEETLHADPYATIDIRCKQGIGEHLNLFVNIENLLNAGDHQFLAIQPLTVSGGLSLQ